MGKWKRTKSLSRRWQRNHLIQKYGANCYLCKRPFASLKDVTVDHWEPLSKGGTDTLDNYRPAHDGCNQLKRDMAPEQYVEFQAGLIQYES